MLRRVYSALVLSVIALGPTNALADRMHRPQPTCFSGPFSGPYVGAGIGWAKQNAHITDQIGGSEFSGDDTSFSFGGYAGYNWQCDRIVFGLEADINSLDTSATAADGTSSLASKVDWYGMLRARGGLVVHEDVLLYVTGGLAYGEVDHTLSDSGLAFSQTNTDSMSGWTLGGGVEFLRDTRWLLRAEAFYVDLGSTAHNYVASPCGGGSCTASAKWEDEFWVGRIGLSYKFGDPDPVVPLK